MAGKPSTKLFYKIGEVCRLTGIKPHILRYWESEFPTLAPTKSSGGQRVYQHRDLDTVLRIKSMLYEEGFTIAGARKKLSGGRSSKRQTGSGTDEVLGHEDSGRTGAKGGPGNGTAEACGKEVQIADALGRFRQEIKDLLEIMS